MVSIDPFALLPTSISLISLLWLRHRFARCSRDLKRLEGVTRSPCYSSLTSTIQGLKVIRSYRAENITLNEFHSNQDNNTRTHFLFHTVTRWAAIRFDMSTVFFIILVTSLAIIARAVGRSFSSADFALTLSISFGFLGLLQWAIRCVALSSHLTLSVTHFRQSVEFETQMTAVERVLEYASLDQEPPAYLPPPHQPPINWPSHGHLVFHQVSMSYSDDPSAPLALHNISFIVEPRQKIGIVGRTGAGKSSLIQALFRLSQLNHGQIIIDGIDIATIGLADLRRRLSIIPQDPVLFNGTLRSNLDPFGDYSDVELWHALEQVSCNIFKLLYQNYLSLIGSAEESSHSGHVRRVTVVGEREWIEFECGSETASLSRKSDTEKKQNFGDRRGNSKCGQCVSV